MLRNKNTIWNTQKEGVVSNSFTYLFLFFLLLNSSLCCSQIVAHPVYVDAERGNDKNSGKTSDQPWKTLGKLNKQEFGPGATIFLKAGNEWKGQLQLKGNGNEQKPIVIKKYGEGKKPVINGGGNRYAVLLINQSYWELEDIEVTNFSVDEEGMELNEWEIHNASYWSSSTEVREQYKADRSVKVSILVLASDKGAIKHLYFRRLHIHGVNGDISTKHNGGIFFEITGEKVPTYFDDILIEDCYIHDVDRTGISNVSSWDQRTRDKNVNWTPSKNILIRNNVFERTGANALIVRVADNPVIENNLFDHCAIKESGNANFPFNCDNAVIQYNKAQYTKYNEGDVDADGFDSDYRCKNTLIQYNLSYRNEFGGLLICCMGGNKEKFFNDGTIVRYNIFQENKHHVIRVSGPVTNSEISNNLFLINDTQDSLEIIWHKSWRGYSDKTIYQNNFIYNLSKGVTVNQGESTATTFINNVVLGNEIGGINDDSEISDMEKGQLMFIPFQFTLLEKQWQKIKDGNRGQVNKP